MAFQKIYGLVGYPVKHSLSKKMQNAAFAALNIPAEYRLFELEPYKLEGFLLDNIKVPDIQGEEFNSQDIIGFNVTIPHKVKAREILEKKFPLSFGKLALEDQYYVKLSGAINTVNRENNQYYNTDAWGFLRALKSQEKKDWGLGFSPADKPALVIGSGGAGRAVIAALSWKKMMKKIYINDIDENALRSAKEHFFRMPQREDLKKRLDFFSSRDRIPEVVGECELVVNASPVGMKEGDDPVIDKQWLRKDLYVYDVVYNRETQLVRDAWEVGCRAERGKGMLLYQGFAAFCFWFPRLPEEDKQKALEAMRRALN